MRGRYCNSCSVSVLVTVASILVANGVIVRYYNEVRHKEYTNFSELEKEYLTLEGRRTNTNLFVGVSNPECKQQLESAALRGVQRHAGGDVVAVVTLPALGFPLPLDGCAEAFYYPINSSIAEPKSRSTDMEHVALTRWGAEQMPVSIVFTNNFDFPVEYFWIDESAEPTSQGTMRPGMSYDMQTYLGHIFYAVEAHPAVRKEKISYEDIIDFMVVDGLPYAWSSLNRLETCEIVPGSVSAQAAAGTGLFVDQDALTCDNMETRFVEFSHTVWHVKRLGLNYVQPQLVPPVTKEGFMHLKMPPGTHAWLKAWYDKQQLLLEDKEGSSGPCMNQHVSPSAITHLTQAEKDRLSADMKNTLEAWYGGELELTSIYGIRKYTNGSVLRMHVDTVNTHVVSAIINVDQALDQEWPLLILDHNDTEHEVHMKPGDMVLYESAKLLHGRPTPMNGAHYDNIFIHYRPISGWDYSWV